MATIVATIELRLHVTQAMNLKDKRRVLKGFKDRLRNRFNVSVAEVEGQDSHRRAILVVAMAGNDKTYVEGCLQQIANTAAMHRDMVLMDHQIQWLA